MTHVFIKEKLVFGEDPTESAFGGRAGGVVYFLGKLFLFWGKEGQGVTIEAAETIPDILLQTR